MGKLLLVEDPDPCHVLDGRTVHAHAALDLRLSGERWLRCQYRWNGDPETSPVFCLVLGGEWEERIGDDPSAIERAPEAVLRVELADAEFRWPMAD
jgi:hypothetical protein